MNDKLLKLWNDPRRSPILIGVIAFNAGIGLGYYLGKRAWVNLEAKRVSEELDVDNAKNFIKVTYPTFGEDSAYEISDTDTINTTSPLLPDGETLIIVQNPDDDEDRLLVTRSVFDHHEDWDYEKEKKKRTTTEPYVIHRDEFFSEESEYTQSTLTYYAGDNILVDENETPIYNHTQILGDLLFGHGSGDPNVVYIRNDKRKAEYEVVHDKGLYSVEVLGLEIEDNQRVKDLKHSRVPKFREE